MGRKSIYLIIAVIFAFLVILSGTRLIRETFGKKAELISLAVVAILLIVLLVLNNGKDKNKDKDNKNEDNKDEDEEDGK